MTEPWDDDQFEIPEFLTRSRSPEPKSDRMRRLMGGPLKAVGIAAAVGFVAITVYGAEGGFGPPRKLAADAAPASKTQEKPAEGIQEKIVGRAEAKPQAFGAIAPTLTPAPPPPALLALSASATPPAPKAPAAAQAAPAAPPAPPAPATPTVVAVAAPQATAVHGLDSGEIRFGMASPFSGANRESGAQLKIGVETAFDVANETGGVNGRKLRLIAEDDGYEPARTLGVVRDLYENKDVFGYICDFGSATAAVAVPYALDHKALFFGALSGAPVTRRDPPDRYVFNFRPSYAEETGAAVNYLTRVRRIPPREIAVFAQDDAFGDAGFDGVAKAMRGMPDAPTKILKLTYKRNTIDVADAARALQSNRGRIKAVIMVATYRAAAKFIEKTREAMPEMIYTNVSAVGATSLADELKLLGPTYANGVIVTQVTPDVSGASSAVLKYKAALAKYFPGEPPDYTSFEAYIDANIVIDAMRRAGRDFDVDKLVDALEATRDFDMGLGGPLRFSDNDHQASHKVWGTMLTAKGVYQPIDLK